MTTHKQLTLAEVFEDCQNKFDNDKYQVLSLLDEAINLDEIVPVSTTIYLWLIFLTASKKLPILLLKLLECR